MATRKSSAQNNLAPSVEISPVAIPDKSWSFRHNDERVTYEQYNQLAEDHKQWVKEQESKSASNEDSKPVSKKRSKKSSR